MTEPFPVVAARVSLVAIPSVVLATGPRDATKDTVAATLLDARGSAARVVYPPDFAGDASVLFASVLARREACEPPGAMVGAIVEREIGVAIGNMGTHAQPAGGRVEIGYAIAPAYENRGYASEMLAAFTQRLLAEDDVVEIVAETLSSNMASMRVLEKNGFRRAGERVDLAGPFVLWSRRR